MVSHSKCVPGIPSWLTKCRGCLQVQQILVMVKNSYLLKSLFIGKTIWMDTSDNLLSRAWVKTGVVMGIFSIKEFLPNIYLEEINYIKLLLPKLKEQRAPNNIWLNWTRRVTHPATSLKPDEPESLSPFVSATTKGSYFLNCSHKNIRSDSCYFIRISQ